MRTRTDTEVRPPSGTAPVDDLLLVYLGQTRGGRTPEGDGRAFAPDVQDLWDHLGDFA
jgi:hypothetical protein